MVFQHLKSTGRGTDIASLIGLTAWRLEMMADQLIFKPMNLSAASFRIIALLEKNGPLIPTDILDYLGGTKSNITQRLNFLGRSGLISSERVKNGDQRKILISLTDQGQATLSNIKMAFKKYDIHAEEFFSAAELKSFQSFMEKLNEGLNKCEQDILKK